MAWKFSINSFLITNGFLKTLMIAHEKLFKKKKKRHVLLYCLGSVQCTWTMYIVLCILSKVHWVEEQHCIAIVLVFISLICRDISCLKLTLFSVFCIRLSLILLWNKKDCWNTILHDYFWTSPYLVFWTHTASMRNTTLLRRRPTTSEVAIGVPVIKICASTTLELSN